MKAGKWLKESGESLNNHLNNHRMPGGKSWPSLDGWQSWRPGIRNGTDPWGCV